MPHVITIVDYGMGNIGSVFNAIKYLGFSARVSSDPFVVSNSLKLILPGVGSFGRAMSMMRLKQLDLAILEAVQNRGAKILGICLGMQLLAEVGTEDGYTQGLCLIPGTVKRFNFDNINNKKIPHIGFNQVFGASDSVLFKGLPANSDFYFVHSYMLLPGVTNSKESICTYGVDFIAALEYKNIFGTQFHPEKSQINGLLLLKNFLER